LTTTHLSPLLSFFNDTATTEIYTLSLHDALPIYQVDVRCGWSGNGRSGVRGLRTGAFLGVAADGGPAGRRPAPGGRPCAGGTRRSEEHTSELQSRGHLVCRLLLEKKKRIRI